MEFLQFDWNEANIGHLARHQNPSEAEQVLKIGRSISNRIFAMAKSAWRKWENRTRDEFSS